MKRTLLSLFLVSALLLMGSCGTNQEPATTENEASNPFVGTWVFNPEKSTINLPEYNLKSDTVKIEALDNGLKFTLDRVDTEGNNIHVEESPLFDGRDYPVTGDTTDDTASLTRINTNSFELIAKKDGVETTRVVVVISEDGKVSTATLSAKDEQGQEVTSTFVYDKQAG